MSKWDSRIEKAEKFFEKSREHGRKVYARYTDERKDDFMGLQRVNIFYANVHTIKESLFNSLPKPDVSRLHKGDYEDDQARVAALVIQRGLTYEINCAKSFDAAIKAAILDRLVPGIGQTWLRFEEPEAIFIDVLYWEDFIYEPARCWEQVTWVGRKHELTKKTFIDTYGEDAFKEASAIKDDNNITPKQISEGKYCVYEIWDKKTRKVYHICKGAEKPIKELDDPYGLPDFFPCPRPLVANPTTASFLPVTDYYQAQDQYNELDVLYARMALITKAVKVAGVYDSGSPEIGRMLEVAENRLIPVDNWAMYAEKGGAKGVIDWYPIEVIVQVYQALQLQYEGVKATLYEVTGMSDIMRGASNQYETAAAQQIKAQFASVRMNGYQRDVAEFVRDILRIMSRLMCKLYSEEKFLAIIGTFNEADKQLLPAAAKILRSDIFSHYKVDIEADSLTQADWGLEKEQRMELVGYVSQFLTSAVPAVQETPELGPLLLAMIKFSIAGFKGAAEIEGILDQQLAALTAKAQNPQPPKPTPEEQKAQAEMQKMQMEAEIKERESQQKMAIEQMQAKADMAVERQKMENEMLIKRMELAHQQQMNEMEIRMKQMELMFKREEQTMNLENQAVSGQMKLDQQAQQAKQKEKANDSKED